MEIGLQKKAALILTSLLTNSMILPPSLAQTAPTTSQSHAIILFIWDGLRPDSITAQDTPNLYKLKQKGAWFTDHHSSYPTFTMMNAASFATGNLAGKTGFFGNTLWNPKAQGVNAEGEIQNFKAPIFTEDYKILQGLNSPQEDDALLFSETLFAIAHKHKFTTAAVGKSGPAFLQNYEQEAGIAGIVIDEKHLYPYQLAKDLTEEGYPLPKTTPLGFQQDVLKLSFDNGDPTKFHPIETIKVVSSNALGLDQDFIYPENVTADPTATSESPYAHANEYLLQTYLSKILPTHQPKLTVLWLRNPDTTEHKYGVGSASYHKALQEQDKLLGKLLTTLDDLNLREKTNLLIVSDHSHSNVSGPLNEFPLRLIHRGMVSVPDTKGYSVSGDFRPADLLTRAGFKAFDGEGCEYDPTLSGIKPNGEQVYPIKIDNTGQICAPNQSTTKFHPQLYTTPAYRVPSTLPTEAIVVANNGGSTYFYLPKHNPKLAEKLVRFIQSREEFGPVFVDDRYNTIPGALPLSLIKLKNIKERNPDVIASSNFDDTAKITDMPGIEFSSTVALRGSHGSFSRTDIHNTLLAIGPDFKTEFVDSLPSANVDVPATIAYLLNLPLSDVDGRPLLEALKKGLPLSAYSLVKENLQPANPATNLIYQLATNPDGKDIDPSKTRYQMKLQVKLLLAQNQLYSYYDTATAVRY